jgi:hypothetical protein
VRPLTLAPLCLLLCTGCISARFHLGNPVQTEPLETTLRIGESTPADVLRVLGPPMGKGRSFLPIDASPRTVWAYGYGEAVIQSNETKDIRVTQMWIYFDGERYDGYLWFSTLPKPAP